MFEVCQDFFFAFLQGRRHWGGGRGRGVHGSLTSLRSKKKKGRQRKKRKVATIKRLSTKSEYYCFNHSRVSRIRKFFLSANYGGRQYFSVFNARPPSTLKSISPARSSYGEKMRWIRRCACKLIQFYTENF